MNKILEIKLWVPRSELTKEASKAELGKILSAGDQSTSNSTMIVAAEAAVQDRVA